MNPFEKVLPLAQEYYKIHRAGGNLHVVLDDGNCTQEDVELCLRQASRENDELGVRLAQALLNLSFYERYYFVTALYEQYGPN
ncbi:MAG: hypothetical protein AB1861_03475 [Cyanobacteriota bacterium]